MASLENDLQAAALRLEPEIQSRLKGFLGGFVRAYLPQTWVFETDGGSASLTVDSSGHAIVESGAVPAPDVTVVIDRAELSKALATRAARATPPRSARVTPHTAKGRAAFDYLRGRLGL